MAKTESGAAGQGAPFTLPADLANHTAEQLDELYAAANAELDGIIAERDKSKLPRATELSQARNTIKARRAELAAEQTEIDNQFKALEDELATDKAEAEAPAEVLEGELVDEGAAPASPQLVTASSRPTSGTRTAPRELGGLQSFPSLNQARAQAPAQEAPPAQLAITASVTAKGINMGDQLQSLGQLGTVIEERAKALRDQAGFRQAAPGGVAFRERARRHTDPFGGVVVASMRNQELDTVFSEDTSLDVIAAWVSKIQRNQNASQMASLVAAGGWCAPSQIRYDFFNIAAQSGMIDLPTFGVERGGIQYPISPSLADTFSPALPWYTAFSNATVPWLWTEADDILAATGSPTKPCVRVPCSTMDNKRLECYGICLTAGNLADNAWPEATANFLRLLMAAHYHASNARYISTIQGMATAVAGCAASGTGAVANILYASELTATSTRAKFGMAPGDVVEQVYPLWTPGLIRADLAKRMGIDPNAAFNISDADIARWFDVRGVRAQFVSDYQVRASGQPGAATTPTSYPSTVKFLNYAAGTVARGNGMSLDLGVVRDSTLNETNDFTAAWMEECHLIARFGHEVLEVTVNACPDGTVGAADLTACC